MGALWNPAFKEETLPKLVVLREKSLQRKPSRNKPTLKPRQGQIHESVKHVLEVASKPMHMRDIHRSVEQELGRQISYATIKSCLNEPRRRTVLFDRVGRGVYQLHIEVVPPDLVARRRRHHGYGPSPELTS